MKILIFGMSGSGKTTLARPLAKLLGAVHFNEDEVRRQYDAYWLDSADKPAEAWRLRYLADGAVAAGKIVVTDFEAADAGLRSIYKPDFTIWMDTLEGADVYFERPKKVDYHVAKWFDDTHEHLVRVVKRYMEQTS